MNALIAFLSVWFAIPIIYSLVVIVRCGLWERRQVRLPNGFLQAAEPFDCGNVRAGTAILFVHGFVDAPKFFERAAKAAAGTNRCFCRVMRVPGWGMRPRFGAQREKVDTIVWRDAVIDEILNLQAAFPRVCVVAHSLGGAISFAAVRKLSDEHARLPDSLVLIAPLFRVSSDRSPLFPPHVWHTIVRFAMPLIRVVESPIPVERIDEDYEFAYSADKFVHLDILSAMFRLVRENMRAPLPTEIPLLLIVAEQEHVVDNSAAFEKLSGWKNMKTIQMDCEHPILMRRSWRETTRAIIDFCL